MYAMCAEMRHISSKSALNTVKKIEFHTIRVWYQEQKVRRTILEGISWNR